jgi:hypothetical protein
MVMQDPTIASNLLLQCNCERCLVTKINLSKNYIHWLKVVFYMSTSIAVSLILLKNPALKRLRLLKIKSYKNHN